MSITRKIIPLLNHLPPELAHRSALWGLRFGLAGKSVFVDPPSLGQDLWGLHFRNPVGLAAGFAKNGESVRGLFRQGLGAVEIGTVVPRLQIGNPTPRLFRLPTDEAIINAMGFNSLGMQAVARRLKRVKSRPAILGINIGKNRKSQDFVEDFRKVAKMLFPYGDYIVVNVSSPNTEGLRKLQEKPALEKIIDALMEERIKAECQQKPILVKVSPDLLPHQAQELAAFALSKPLDGLIIGNTTLSRPSDLHDENRSQIGGLSGRPLMGLSTRLLSDFYRLTNGKIPLIGVGGIFSAEDAWKKICAGASLVQLYTGLAYRGPQLIDEIRRDLVEYLRRSRLQNIAQAVGSDHRKKP